MSARVLVVDDVEPNVRLLEAKLQFEYFDVITAFSGEEALTKSRTQNPDVILLDVMMPGLDGFETCRRLKDDVTTRHIPVVMVTALDQREDRVKGLAAGADDFLTKPVDDVALLARVKSLSRHKMVLDELRAREANGRRIGVIEGQMSREMGLGARILIVDDNQRQAERIVRALEIEQRPILMSEANAMGPDSRASLELIVVATGAKTFDGLRLAAQMRSREPTRRVPMLAIVEPDEQKLAVKALEIGVNDFIYRPIDPEEIAARVRTLVRQKRYADQLRASVDQSMEMAVTDQLTGLHNRRYMETQLRALMSRARVGGAPLSVLITDIDFFKHVNDRYGHDTGDRVLEEFATRLTAGFRPRDLVCRFGGEEFVVLMPDTYARDAYAIADRLRGQIAESPFELPGGSAPLSITVSIGVATSQIVTDTPDSILKRADEALYAAKASGRNRVIAEVA
jgi:two-component system, cell cycle response regulator